MNAQTKVEADHPLAKLRKEFPPNQISKLPKETRAQIDARKTDKTTMVFNCPVCGGHHHKNAVHLDYVGHAALTDRLLDADMFWSWEPMAFGPDGLPAFDRNGGLWIRLTVCGVTRPGYGAADGKSGGDAIKEIIGDALRNAAMRFGAALDLWHNGTLHLEEGVEPTDDPPPPINFEALRDQIEVELKGASAKRIDKVMADNRTAIRRASTEAPETYAEIGELFTAARSAAQQKEAA